MMEVTYTISIVATSPHFNSTAVDPQVTLSEALIAKFKYDMSLHFHASVPLPTEPIVSVDTITATSISLSWSVPTDQMVTSSEVMWQESSNTAEAKSSGKVTMTIYTMDGLESSTKYTITVTVTNKAGNTTSSPDGYYW